MFIFCDRVGYYWLNNVLSEGILCVYLDFLKSFARISYQDYEMDFKAWSLLTQSKWSNFVYPIWPWQPPPPSLSLNQYVTYLTLPAYSFRAQSRVGDLSETA